MMYWDEVLLYIRATLTAIVFSLIFVLLIGALGVSVMFTLEVLK